MELQSLCGSFIDASRGHAWRLGDSVLFQICWVFLVFRKSTLRDEGSECNLYESRSLVNITLYGDNRFVNGALVKKRLRRI